MNERLDKRKAGVTGAALKWIAMLSMLLDHVGYVLVPPLWRGTYCFSLPWSQDALWQLYLVLRRIGRPAFPIYLFLLAEGFAHSRSRGRYLLRMSLFALLSELPFDLAFYGKLFYPDSQNVFFTLGIGLAALIALDALLQAKGPWLLRLPALLAVAVAAPLAARALHADYGAAGVAALELQYAVVLLCRKLAGGEENLPWRFVRWSIMLPPLLLVSQREWWLMAALPAVLLYNGRRGRQRAPWLFYAYYPAHLLLLAGLDALLRIA